MALPAASNVSISPTQKLVAGAAESVTVLIAKFNSDKSTFFTSLSPSPSEIFVNL